jgi:uncharacterized membrane protein
MSEQPHPSGPSDERVEGIIGNLLRVGVMVSAFVVFTGGLLYLLRDGSQHAPDLHKFEPEQLRSPGDIVHESVRFHSLGLIMLGLLLLIATPIARVIFSVAAFALQRDYLYVLFTLIVLSVLLYSVFSGYLSGGGGL